MNKNWGTIIELKDLIAKFISVKDIIFFNELMLKKKKKSVSTIKTKVISPATLIFFLFTYICYYWMEQFIVLPSWKRTHSLFN